MPIPSTMITTGNGSIVVIIICTTLTSRPCPGVRYISCIMTEVVKNLLKRVLPKWVKLSLAAQLLYLLCVF